MARPFPTGWSESRRFRNSLLLPIWALNGWLTVFLLALLNG